MTARAVRASALAAAVVAPLAIATPASAHTWTGAHVQKGTHYTGGSYKVVNLIKYDWKRQADGDGVKIEAAWTDVDAGCGDLEDFPALKNQSVITNRADGTILNTRTMSDVDCHASYDFELLGPDKGPSVVTYKAEVNVDNGKNYCLYISVRLFADGDWDSQSHGKVPCS